MKKRGGGEVGGKKGKTKSGGFESLKLGEKVYGGIKRKGYKVPTPIQRKTLPLILSGYDVVAMARTGSGKTAAFLIPMLHRLTHHVPQAGLRALILSPTRDLALQTLKFAKELAKFTDIRISLLVGGDNMESQFEELAQNPDVIIATPGRLMHHLSEVEDMSLRTVEYVVFDEADSLFSMGFAEQMKQILTQLRENRQTLLFSATLPSGLAEFAKAGLRDPQVVRLDLETKISPDLKLVFFTLHQEEKNAALLYLVRDHLGSDQQTLIFVSTKHHAEFLNVLFREEGIEPSVCYGAMDQDARKINVARFRARKTMLLIVTDVAARGIDIPLLDNVVNWDFPPTAKIFVHRVGRVARAGRQGTSFSFVTPNDMPYLLDLHLFLSKKITAATMEGEVLEGVKGDTAAGNGETVYGRFRQDIIDLISDHVRETVDSSAELTSLQKTCRNAFTLYSSNRPKPSSESIRRVKALPREGMHPIFRNTVGANELSTLAFTERLRNFRPKITILEAEGAAAKSKNIQGSSSQWVDIMKKKRAVHDETIDIVYNQHLINQVHKETESERRVLPEKKVVGFMKFGGCFKDEEYFIDAVPKSHHLESGLSAKSNEKFGSTRMDAAVLDLVADDSQGIHKQKSNFHWDRRAKKYVRLNNGDRVTSTGKVKNESGSKRKAGRTGIYNKWKERCHSQIRSNNGEDACYTDTNFRGGVGRSRGGGKKESKIANAHLGTEMKSMDQIRKVRLSKSNAISHLRQRQLHKSHKNNSHKYNSRPPKSN